MATPRYFVCSDCKTKEWVPRLFDALKNLADGRIELCKNCGKPASIELEFFFGLNAGQNPCTVLAAFLPKEQASWDGADNSVVEFFPFIVILQSPTEQSVWMPYWHRVISEDKHTSIKYGQWAAFLDSETFDSLVSQAKESGYLK